MRSGLTPEVRTALRSGRIALGVFAAFSLRYTTARFWTGLGKIKFLGAWWGGMGEMAGVSEIEETAELRAAGMSFSLNGLPQTTASGRNLVEYVEFHAGGGGKVEAHIGLFDPATGAMIRDGRQIFAGRVDAPQIALDGNKFSVTINAEGIAARLNQKPGQRFNDESHKKEHPGDRFFEFVPRTQHKPDEFG